MVELRQRKANRSVRFFYLIYLLMVGMATRVNNYHTVHYLRVEEP